jgi:hypothetical protein
MGFDSKIKQKFEFKVLKIHAGLNLARAGEVDEWLKSPVC